jgi:DNA polymerase-3 subunit beta
LLPEGDVQVKIQENHWANLVSGRSRTRIAGMSRESFPELPETPEVLAEIPIGLLASMIGKTIFAISTEESRFTLNGALLVLKKGGLVLVATDGHRLAMTESSGTIEGITGSYRALLPRKAMAELQKLAGDADPAALVRFSGNENHLFFELGERLLLSRKLTGNFPDYERVLPKDHPQSVTLNREELRGAIERVAQFSDERSRGIRFQVTKGEVKIHSSVSDTGESEESIPAPFEGEGVEIGFNAQYLLDFLRAVGTDEVGFLFKDPHSAGELRPGGEKPENYRYVIMPMRL